MACKRALYGFALSVLGFLMAGAGDLRASAFTVTPVRVLLGRNASSALLTVKNDSTEPLRFQITLKAWNQKPDGGMELTETNDLVYFPSIMELKPGEEKNVRVGSSFKAPVVTERSYRIFFEELPSPQVAATPAEKQASAQVRVLTKMGVPIFVQPPTPIVEGAISGVKTTAGKLDFDVLNKGNSFFLVNGAKVVGMSKAGQQTFELSQDGWYLLAGGSRHYQFAVPAAQCAGTDVLRIDIQSTLSDSKGNPIPLAQDVPAAEVCGTASGAR